MNLVITFNNAREEWYQDTYTCHECETEFMTDQKDHPRFCPQCGVKFDAVRIKHLNPAGYVGRETIFLNNEKEEEK